MKRELREFIKEALERGHDRDAIRSVLLEAGWQEGEIRNGLSGFAAVNFPVAVPRPAAYLYAREAFLYLVSFIALYVAAISFGILAFGLIDHAFPDALDYRDRYPSAGQATAIASVIIAFPLYLFLTRRLALHVGGDPERRQSPVRRWLTYFTLVVAAGVILGDLIALLANVLAGDPTIRFALKAVSILAIATCIFGFYLWDMRQAESTALTTGGGKSHLVLLAVVSVVVVGCIAYSLFLMGSPGQQRDIRLDQERVWHLSNIAANVDVYWELNGELPTELALMSGSRYHINRIHDPETSAPYEYRAVEGAQYELCATFSTDSAETSQRDQRFSDRMWEHGVGRICFQLGAQGPLAPKPASPEAIE